MRDGKLLLRITLVLVLCLLARQSSAYVKILTAPGHPVSLIVEHDEGRIRKAFFRSPEGVRPLEHIEQHLLLSDSLTFLCADDDIRTQGNPGRTKASEAAEMVSGFLAIPDFGADRPTDATDFNDMAALRGLDAVRRAIEGTMPVRLVPVRSRSRVYRCMNEP